MKKYPNIFVNENSIMAQYKKHNDGQVSWYIPVYDIYFSSLNFDAGKKKINPLIQMYSSLKYRYL